jgi:zinc/manganese transport system permease protein
MIVVATAAGILSGYAGLLVSFHTRIAAGPAIILAAGALYATSVLFGPVGGLMRRLRPRRHLEA